MVIKNQAGISLLQVVIAAGLVSVMALALMRISANQSQLNTRFGSENNLHQIEALLLGYLSKGSTCSLALSGMSRGENLQFINVTGDLSKHFLEVGEEIAATGWEVSSIRLLNTTEIQDAGIDVFDSLGSVTLRVGVSQTKQVIGGRDRFLYVTTTADTCNLDTVYEPTLALLYDACDEEYLSEVSDVGFGVMGICCDPTTGNQVYKCGN